MKEFWKADMHIECVILLPDGSVEKGNLSIEYMNTNNMWADYMSKLLQGYKFCKHEKIGQAK